MHQRGTPLAPALYDLCEFQHVITDVENLNGTVGLSAYNVGARLLDLGPAGLPPP